MDLNPASALKSHMDPTSERFNAARHLGNKDAALRRGVVTMSRASPFLVF